MTALIPFTFETSEVRVLSRDNEPWFVLADVCRVLELENPRNVTARLDDDEKGVQIVDTLGSPQEMTVVNESGLYSLILTSRKAAARRFRKWVTAEVLPTIRKTGSYSVPGRKDEASDAFKLVPIVVRAARALGLDKNAAALSANQVVTKLTGMNVLHLPGHTHLTAEDQSSLYFTPTKLGERLGCSARKVNLPIADAGLQTKNGDYWTPLEAAQGFYRIFDTGKRHSNGGMVQQIEWSKRVLPFLQQCGQA